MAKISADNVLFTFGMFAILMIAFGQTVPNADVQNNMNTLFERWPTLADSIQPTPSCSDTDVFCQAQAGIERATAFIAVPFLWFGALVLSALVRISAFGNLLSFVTFGSTAAFGTVPFGFLFLLALFLVVAVEMFRLFRGSPSGL
jgi:hypothetical protein